MRGGLAEDVLECLGLTSGVHLRVVVDRYLPEWSNSLHGPGLAPEPYRRDVYLLEGNKLVMHPGAIATFWYQAASNGQINL